MLRRIRLAALGIAVATVVVAVGGCTSDSSSQDGGELTPIWVFDVNRDSGRVSVLGRVSTSESVFDGRVVGIGSPSEGGELAPPLELISAGPFSGIRLTDGDAMSVVVSNRRRQLYRRDAALLYTRDFAFDPNTTEVSLRLDYTRARFEPSVATVRTIDVSNFTVAERDQVVPMEGTLNLSWNIGDVESGEDVDLSTYIVATLTGCDSADEASRTVVLDVDGSARSVALTVDQLPQPTSDETNAASAGSAASTCSYDLQHLAILQPSEPADNLEPAAPGSLDTTPRIAVVNRSMTAAVRVGNGPES